MALAQMEMFVSEAATAQTGGALPFNVKLSASMASPGAAFQIPAGLIGKFLVRSLPVAASYVATGGTSAAAVSNAANAGTNRQPLPASAFYDFYANPGDWIAWALA